LSRVAIDRGLRLAEKRQLPLGPRRQKWLDARDALYEEIQVRQLAFSIQRLIVRTQEKAWNPKRGFYSQVRIPRDGRHAGPTEHLPVISRVMTTRTSLTLLYWSRHWFSSAQHRQVLIMPIWELALTLWEKIII